ncbi:hypothetical protein PSPO01_01001 [Paraphaeosphaeria sporulosa]
MGTQHRSLRFYVRLRAWLRYSCEQSERPSVRLKCAMRRGDLRKATSASRRDVIQDVFFADAPRAPTWLPHRPSLAPRSSTVMIDTVQPPPRHYCDGDGP